VATVITPDEVKKLHVMKITNSHTFKHLWPDLKQFSIFLRKCLNKTLKWSLYPFSNEGLALSERTKLSRLYDICLNFQLEGVANGVDEDLVERIGITIRGRKLIPILEIASSGITSEYVDFLSGLHDFYNEKCAEEENGDIGGQKLTSNLWKLWSNDEFILPDRL
jgi:hypothetical protein